MKRLDKLLALAVGLAMVPALAYGAHRGEQDAGSALAAFVPGGVVMGGIHEDIDPLRPPGLPAGVTVDPATGRLVGAPEQALDGVTWITWEDIASPEDTGEASDIPQSIHALHGKRVALLGFVYPLYDPLEFREFLLVASSFTCCYGTKPGIDEMIYTLVSKDADPLNMDPRPIRLTGTFHIEVQRMMEDDPESPVVLLYKIDDATVAYLSDR